MLVGSYGGPTSVVWGVVYLTVADAVANRTGSVAGRLLPAARHLPRLLLVGLALVATVVGLALLVLPGLYLFGRLVLAFPACVVDQKGPIAGLTAGWSASKGPT